MILPASEISMRTVIRIGNKISTGCTGFTGLFGERRLRLHCYHLVTVIRIGNKISTGCTGCTGLFGERSLLLPVGPTLVGQVDVRLKPNPQRRAEAREAKRVAITDITLSPSSLREETRSPREAQGCSESGASSCLWVRL